MTWSARMARRAAARTMALVSVLAAGGVIAGTASAAGGHPGASQAVAASLAYGCRFPSGRHQVTVTVTADIPRLARTGRPIQPTRARLTIAFPSAATADLARLHAATVRAATALTIDASEGTLGTSVVWPGTTRTEAAIPKAGGLTLRTSAPVPSVTAMSPGDVLLAAAGLTVTLSPGTAGLAVPSAAPRPVSGGPNQGPAPTVSPSSGSSLQLSCALAPGQQAALATVQVAGPAARHSRRAPTVGKCPKLPPGGLKLNPRFPPPPHPKLTLEAHVPNQGCAYTTGYADARKLNGAALIAPGITNVWQTINALENTTNKVNYIQLDNAAQLEFHGLHEFPPSTATFLTFGFVPTTATIELVEHGTINIFVVGPANPFIHCTPNKFRTCNSVAKVYSRLSVRIVPGSVKVNGVPLDVGAHCETPPFDAVLTGTDASNPKYSIQFGGPLTGFVTIPRFTNCGAGENLDPIFNAAISGPRNFNLLTQGDLCTVQGAFGCDNHGRPKIPTPLRHVIG